MREKLVRIGHMGWAHEPELREATRAVATVVGELREREASLVHLSHGQLFGGQNPGMDSIGVRLTLELP